MTYKEFTQVVLAAGLEPRCCNPLHWQIRGGEHIVNFYPDTKRGQRFYVDRTERATNGSLDKALRAAKGEIRFPMLAEPAASTIRHDIHSRWQQHKRSGGKLTLEQFNDRALRRERLREEAQTA
jgi:hypothetical protein